jgi:hypothetical protein
MTQSDVVTAPTNWSSCVRVGLVGNRLVLRHSSGIFGLPQLIAFGNYQQSWLLYVIRPVRRGPNV